MTPVLRRILLSAVLGFTGLSLSSHSPAAESETVILLFGAEGDRSRENASLIEASVQDFLLPTRLERKALPAELSGQKDAILDGDFTNEIRALLRSNNADLAIVLDDFEDEPESEGLGARIIGFPVEGNHPDFPTKVVEVPIVREKAYISPILNLRISQAVANSLTPDPQNAKRYAALMDYSKSIRALDRCAPVGGFSNQVLILGRIVAPSQLLCDGLILSEALFAQTTVGSEFADTLSVEALARLGVNLTESLLLLAIRSADWRLFDKAIEVAEGNLASSGGLDAELSLVQGLILRGATAGRPEDLDRSISIVDARLPSQDRSHFLYRAALSTALFARYRSTKKLGDLTRSVDSSRDALRLQSPAATIEVHLLLRSQLATVLSEYGERTANPEISEEARQLFEFVRKVSLELGHQGLAAFAGAIAN